MKKKDPAFLFYSNKFYEGTRTLLPEERACLVDLMIYQHQRGIIPDDPRRVAMYCTGTSEATLQATLEAKFKRVDGGWISETMCEVMDDRKEYAEKQAVNGRIGQFWKKAKAILSTPDYKKLRSEFLGLDLQETHSIISEIQPTKEGLKGWLKQRLSRTLKDVDVIKDEDTVVIEDKGRGDARGETEVQEVITHLNEIAGCSFTASEGNAKYIRARLKEGMTVEELKMINVVQAHKWLGTEWEKYLRPATLYNSEKAGGYLSEAKRAMISGIAPHKNGMSKIEERNAKLERDVKQIIAQKTAESQS